MYKKAFFFMLMISVCFIVAAGTAGSQSADPVKQEKKESVLSTWLKGLQKKIAQIVPKKTIPITTGVAGVRGAKEEAKVKLYWKGKKGDEPITEEELAKFKAGLELAEKDDKQATAKELEDFMKKYPDSALIPDVKKTLDMVKTEGK